MIIQREKRVLSLVNSIRAATPWTYVFATMEKGSFDHTMRVINPILKMRWRLWSLPSMANPQKTEQNREVLAFLLLGTCLSMNDPWDLVDLDFSNVANISRSFADQFISRKLILLKQRKKRLLQLMPAKRSLICFRQLQKLRIWIEALKVYLFINIPTGILLSDFCCGFNYDLCRFCKMSMFFR